MERLSCPKARRLTSRSTRTPRARGFARAAGRRLPSFVRRRTVVHTRRTRHLAAPLYDMTSNQGRLAGLPGSTWGPFTRYLEIGVDRYATRQVDWFANGYALRYDRDHYTDEFGTLADLRYSWKWKRWWPRSQVIDASAFERIWSSAARTDGASLQARSSYATSWPAKPPWLR